MDGHSNSCLSSSGRSRVEYCHENKALHGRGPYCAGRFTESSRFRPRGAEKVGGHHSTGTQRMDLLDYLREEAGNKKAARREGVHGVKRRNAPTLLLARLPSPLTKASETPHPPAGLRPAYHGLSASASCPCPSRRAAERCASADRSDRTSNLVSPSASPVGCGVTIDSGFPETKLRDATPRESR